MSAQDLYLSALNIEVTSDPLTLQGGENTTELGSDAVFCTLKVPKSAARNMFGVFHVDGIDVLNNENTDIKYTMFVKNSVSDPAKDIDADLKYYNSKNVIPAEASVVVRQIGFYGSNTSTANERKISPDFIRYLAKENFGIPAVDLYANEREVRNQIIQDSSVAFNTMMEGLSAFKVTYNDGEDYVRNLNSTNNVPEGTNVSTGLSQAATITKANNYPARRILRQLLANVPGRFTDLHSLVVPFDKDGNALTIPGSPLTSDYLETHPDLWYRMPLEAGDHIYFTLTISPDANQGDLTSSGSIDPRVYRIRLDVEEDNHADFTDFGDASVNAMTDYKWVWNATGYDAVGGEQLYYLADAQHPANLEDV
jgi:hypothetical protein